MQKRPLGNSGIEVSILGFGAGNIGDPAMPEHDVATLLNSVVDTGITLIDTARSYGLSEERIGRHLKHRRSEIILSTKVGYGVPGFEDWTGPCVAAGVDQARRFLQTDVIDIVHLHSCPLSILQQGDVIRALEDAKMAGKIRVAAYSGDNEPFDWALESGRFGALQTSINVCDQRAIDKAAIAAQRGIGIIGKRTLANAPWSPVSNESDSSAKAYRERWNLMALDLGSLQPAELALRFAAYVPGVSSCLIGTRNMDHLRHNVTMAERGPLPEPVINQIRQAFLSRGGAGWPGQI